MAKALKAAKFCANPTDTMIYESYCELGFPRISSVLIYKGFFWIAPPLVPTAIGIYKLPLK